MSKLKKAIGKKQWAISGGNIPFKTTGVEPEFTSRDWIAVLNTSGKEAKLAITIFYDDCDPVHGFEYIVKPHRVKKIRFNDFIDPFPIQLDKPFGCIINSSGKVVIQFNRMNTEDSNIATTGTMAYSE
jgi:hypothetical protein